MLSAWEEERKVRLYGEHANVHQSHSQNDSEDLRGVAGGDGELEGVCVVRQAPVICVMAPPIIWVRGQWYGCLLLKYKLCVSHVHVCNRACRTRVSCSCSPSDTQQALVAAKVSIE